MAAIVTKETKTVGKVKYVLWTEGKKRYWVGNGLILTPAKMEELEDKAHPGKGKKQEPPAASKIITAARDLAFRVKLPRDEEVIRDYMELLRQCKRAIATIKTPIDVMVVIETHSPLLRLDMVLLLLKKHFKVASMKIHYSSNRAVQSEGKGESKKRGIDIWKEQWKNEVSEVKNTTEGVLTSIEDLEILLKQKK